MGVVGRLDQYASMLAWEFDETTANGPRITGLGTYYASEFNENLSDTLTVEYLIVAGGGGGSSGAGGGGGAGGLLTGSISVTTSSYSIVVGSGGTGAGSYPVGNYSPATSGGNSSFSTIIAIGGGSGGGQNDNATSGGSGGGGGGGTNQPSQQIAGIGTVGQGNAGANGIQNNRGGGGGGAGGSGSVVTGGSSLNSSISGISTAYAGGGGAGTYSVAAGNGGGGGAGNGTQGISLRGGDAVANTGSGGGGGGGEGASLFRTAGGGNGGSGIVILRYLGSQRATGGTVTSSGGYTIHTFTTTGSNTFTLPGLPLSANILPPYDPVYDEFGGTLFGAGQGRYMRQNTDKSVIVYNEIDEVTAIYPPIVTTGLVLNLDAGNVSSYPGSGTTWYDLSGNTANSTFGASTAAPTYSSDGGGSIVFDGSNDLVSVPTTSLYDFSALRVTIEVWIKVPSTPTGGNMIVTTDTSGDSSSWNLGFYGGFLCFIPDQYQSRGVETLAPRMPISSFPLNTWNHIVVTSAGNGEVGKLYFNGVSQINGSSTTIGLSYDAGRPLGIGLEPTSGRFPFNGSIAALRIYKNKAFTQAEVSQNFNALRNRFGL